MTNKSKLAIQVQTTLEGYEYSSESTRLRQKRNLVRNNVYSGNTVHDEKGREHARGRAERATRGLRLSRYKAKANKLIKKDLVTEADANVVLFYLVAVSDVPWSIARKVEPGISNVHDKFHSDAWERVSPLDYTGMLHSESISSISLMNRLHNLHVSLEDASQVAYYPSLEYFRSGREVRTKLGRYLTKYASLFQLSESEIKVIAEKHTAKVKAKAGWTLKFMEHDNPDGWEYAYNNGPHSCMKGESAVRVYAHDKSVLRLAYLEAGDEILARCIVRDDEEKGYLRVYPDPNGYAEGRWLLDALIKGGYENRTNLNGVLLEAEEGDDGDYTCPYIDYGNDGSQMCDIHYEDGKEYLILGEGYMECTNTSGYVTNPSSCECECDECSNTFHRDNGHYMETTDRTVCDRCSDNNYTYAMGRWGDSAYYLNEEVIECDDNYYVTDYANSNNVYQCAVTDDWFNVDEMVMTKEGMVCLDETVNLDHADSEGNDYAVILDSCTLTNGKVCHEDDREDLQELIDAEELEAVQDTIPGLVPESVVLSLTIEHALAA